MLLLVSIYYCPFLIFCVFSLAMCRTRCPCPCLAVQSVVPLLIGLLPCVAYRRGCFYCPTRIMLLYFVWLLCFCVCCVHSWQRCPFLLATFLSVSFCLLFSQLFFSARVPSLIWFGPIYLVTMGYRNRWKCHPTVSSNSSHEVSSNCIVRRIAPS